MDDEALMQLDYMWETARDTANQLGLVEVEHIDHFTYDDAMEALQDYIDAGALRTRTNEDGEVEIFGPDLPHLAFAETQRLHGITLEALDIDPKHVKRTHDGVVKHWKKKKLHPKHRPDVPGDRARIRWADQKEKERDEMRQYQRARVEMARRVRAERLKHLQDAQELRLTNRWVPPLPFPILDPLLIPPPPRPDEGAPI